MFTMFTWAQAVAVTVVAVATVGSNAQQHQLQQHQQQQQPAMRSFRSSAAAAPQTNYIITSKPFTVRDDADAGAIKWRRDTVTGASLIGASDPAKAKYSIECTDVAECAGIELGGSDATFKPYTQDELNRILKRYGEADGTDAESSDKILSYEDGSGGTQDKSKASWNLVDAPAQQGSGAKSPYDDRRGWVTLEPMAWSSSHIQKWEPNNRPTWPPPPQDHSPQPGYSPWPGGNRPVQQRPSQGYHQQSQQPPQQQQQQQHYHHQTTDWTTERPWIRPTYDYSPKPSSSSSSHYHHHQKPQAVQTGGAGGFYGGWNSAEPDIITDGKPGQFPADAYHKPSWNGDYGQTSYGGGGPRPTETEGDGQWVLLSSTKGYSIPHRPNRSLQGRAVHTVDAVVQTSAAGGGSGNSRSSSVVGDDETTSDGRGGSGRPTVSASKRTVRLMVLPPDKDAHNVTTSHGGMIQVDVSGKSVDQEQREYAAARALADDRRAENDVQVLASDRSAKADGSGRRAVLAAVGAGMLPAATMAMFLPVMVSRKRRDIAAAVGRPAVVLFHRHGVYPR